MKKVILILVAGLLLWFNTASALPKCTGTYGSLLSWAWTNCYGKATFDDGSSYQGEFYNEKAHGKGLYIFSNGDSVVYVSLVVCPESKLYSSLLGN